MAGRSSGRRVLLLGATGTIGRAAAQALTAAGHDLTCFLRPGSKEQGLPPAARLRHGQVTDPSDLRAQAFKGDRFDVILSCLASRSGAPGDAWAVDHKAHMDILAAAQETQAQHFILLSAICVQRPRLAFQHAKLAFEAALIGSGLTYSIVRPTAYFKSLSGQIGRLRQGKPFLLFGDGRLTQTKPISDADLARYLTLCIEDEALHNRVLPLGGPGPAFTPREQGEWLFEMMGKSPRFRSLPIGALDAIIGGLSLAGPLSPRLRAKAELARIGRYYATESMLCWDEAAGRYDASATPSYGADTLKDFYRRIIAGEAEPDRREHRVF